ncbi:MAG: NAD(P)/FAD-dependent oxidoreductase [Terrimesophilobacter sp.]
MIPVRDAAQHYDCVVIGAGPAGLSAALNLVRARRRVLVLDSNRPRNSATLIAHGFLTRDGITPHELRQLGLEELLVYPSAHHQLAVVHSVRREAGGFRIEATGFNGYPDRSVVATAVLIATGLSETLPDLPAISNFYGIGVFSCIECDGYEQSDRRLALIGETSDLASRALQIAQWAEDLTVFTNGATTVAPSQEALLAERGVRVERREIADLVGEGLTVTGVLLADGDVVPIEGGFVRPRWHAMLDFAAELDMAVDGWGLLVTDADGRTNVTGLYAAGDCTAPGPQQLIVAAGMGARVAATINRDMIGIPRR